MTLNQVIFNPIGVVTHGIDAVSKASIRSKIEFVGEVKVFDEYLEALEGIDEYSHVYIISFLHRAERRTITNASRHGGPSSIGVFSTRYPGRPNPIGLSLVEIVENTGGRLLLRGLDLYTGTPVLDIKPYDYHSIVCKPRVLRWLYEMWAEERSIYEEYGWPGPFCP